MHLVRCDAEAVVLEDANPWPHYYGIVAGLALLTLVLWVGPFVPIGGRYLIPWTDGVAMLVGFGAIAYANLVYQLRYGGSPALSRLRFAGGEVELVALGRERRVRKLELQGAGTWYVLEKGGDVDWRRRPNRPPVLAYRVVPRGRAAESITTALAMLDGETEAASAGASRVYTHRAAPTGTVAPSPESDDLFAAALTRARLRGPGASGLLDDARVEGDYFEITRVGRIWKIRSPDGQGGAGNTLTVDLGREWVRVRDYPQLREIGRFRYLAFFRSEVITIPQRYLPPSYGVVVKLFFRKHHPVTVFTVAGPASEHPAFDGQPLREEAEALCAWLNALLREARRREGAA